MPPSPVTGEIFGHILLVEIILVFASPTGYLLTSSGFTLLNWVYFINPSKMMGNSSAAWNFNWLFLKLNRFICNEISVLPDHCTSRKYCGKKSQSFSHCGLFDHPDLQLLNDCRFYFFCLPTTILGILGLLIYCLKGLENTIPTVYYIPPKF